MVRKSLIALAWLTLLAIAFATLSPIELRPHLGEVSVERFWAFALAGLLFGLAYPRHLLLVALLITGAAAGFEVLQHLTPDRHGHVSDALVKLAGGLSGVAISFALRTTIGRNVAAG